MYSKPYQDRLFCVLLTSECPWLAHSEGKRTGRVWQTLSLTLTVANMWTSVLTYYGPPLQRNQGWWEMRSLFARTRPSPAVSTSQIRISQHPSSPGTWLHNGSFLCLGKRLKSRMYFSYTLFLFLSIVALESGDSACTYEQREELSHCPKTLIRAAENMHY